MVIWLGILLMLVPFFVMMVLGSKSDEEDEEVGSGGFENPEEEGYQEEEEEKDNESGDDEGKTTKVDQTTLGNMLLGFQEENGVEPLNLHDSVAKTLKQVHTLMQEASLWENGMRSK